MKTERLGESSPPGRGKVYLVGAGPGDPKLLTLRAVDVLRECDVALVDRLVNPEILAHLRPGTPVIDVGKRAGSHAMKQAEICALLVAQAQPGRIVARIKGGDPFVYGRGGEEALALVDAGIPWEVVPGVSAGIAAAAYAGIPLTHRGVASRVSFRTAHHADPEAAARRGDEETVVFFMCGSTLAEVARDLVAGGRSARTPVAVVRSGTTADQEVFVGTLADALDPGLRIPSPALAIVGTVVSLERRLRWFGGRASRPLARAHPAAAGADESGERRAHRPENEHDERQQPGEPGPPDDVNRSQLHELEPDEPRLHHRDEEDRERGRPAASSVA